MTTCSSISSPSVAVRSRRGSRRLRLAAWLGERRRRARLAHELSLLDDRELTDLGISRADFPGIIRGTWHR
ncbi:MAG: DUF1127 domain-containing protein [Acetobacteraceae bacterium]